MANRTPVVTERVVPPPPEPLRPLFLPYLVKLKNMLVDVETESFSRAKLNLWRRTMRGSGLVGPGPVRQAHNFAEHTLLVVAARLIVLSTQTDSTLEDLPESVGDGFCAWLLDYPDGEKLLKKLADTISRYDWSAADRDLLKGLYHDLIDREDRKEFGEYYTPDWLAERLVGRVLLGDPSRLDAAIRSAASALGLGGCTTTEVPYTLLDPACGSGTFLFWLATAVTRRIRENHPLLQPHARQVVGTMVTGLDVHPIAVEMAKATLATALPPGPAAPLQVFQADSMGPGRRARMSPDRSGPSRTASLKAAVVVGNPPWLVANDTPEGTRKEQLADLSTRYRLRPKRGSARGDLAAVFSARVVDLYLAKDGAFGFVLPGSALVGQTWAAWREGEWGNTRVGFDFTENYDGMASPPFSHAPNGTSVVAGRRIAQGSEDRTWDKAEALLITGDSQHRKATIRRRRRSKPSPYADRFRRGAVASPLGLCLVITQPIRAGDGLVTVTTKASTKGKWRGVQYTSTIEEAALWPALRSQTLQPFAATPDAWYIAPLHDPGSGLRVLGLGDPEFAELYPATFEYWTKAEECYASNRARTAGATLSANVDRYRTLTGQLAGADAGACTKVFYNKSGNTLRAARGPNSLIADDKLYWYNAESSNEALYLIAVLNAECLQDAWRESKTARQHYDLNPLKHVPAPLFDSGSDAHSRIAQLAGETERDPLADRSELEGLVAELVPGWSIPF